MKKIIFLALAIAVLAAFFASSNPDGLEKVAHKLGFIEKGTSGNSIMTDYRFPLIHNSGISTAVAGVTGTLLIFGAFWLTAKTLKGKNQ